MISEKSKSITKKISKQVCEQLLWQAYMAFSLGFMNESGKYLTHDGKEVEIIKDNETNIFWMSISINGTKHIVCEKKDNYFAVVCNINGEMQLLHPLSLEEVEDTDYFIKETKSLIEELMEYMNIGLIKPNEKKFDLAIDFSWFYDNLPRSDSRRKRAVIVPAINRLFSMTQSVALKDADYVLFTHPWVSVVDRSEECIEQLHYIDKNRKMGAKIIVLGSATNAAQPLGDSIKDIIYLDGNYVKKLGEMFDIPLEEKYVHYNVETGVLEIFPVTGCLRSCSFCLSSQKKRHFSSVPLEKIKEELDHFQKDFPDSLNTIEFFAQNLTEYGIDLSHKQEFPALLRLVASYPEVKEIYLSYGLTISEMKQPILEAILENKEKIKKIGLHFETGSNNLLSLIKKGHTKESAIALINTLRQEIPDITIYSTMMIGLPTETLVDVDETVDLIRKTEIDGILCNYYIHSDKNNMANMPQLSVNQKKRHFEYMIAKLEKEEFTHPLQIQLQGQPLRSKPGERIEEVGRGPIVAYNFGNQENRSKFIPSTKRISLSKKKGKQENS